MNRLVKTMSLVLVGLILATVPSYTEPIRVLATTTIIGDVVGMIGADDIELSVLLPVNADPHGFEPTPKDIAAISDAEVVFINGGGLELGLQPFLERAAGYRAELEELDSWIVEQVEKIPEEKRRLVTDHAAFGYFAERYGFEQVGTVFPGFSTLSDPSAREIAELEDKIRSLSVPAIFVGTTVNPSLTERIASDTGTKVVSLYTGSLSGPDGPAKSYIEMMRYDVTKIVEALSEGECPD